MTKMQEVSSDIFGDLLSLDDLFAQAERSLKAKKEQDKIDKEQRKKALAEEVRLINRHHLHCVYRVFKEYSCTCCGKSFTKYADDWAYSIGNRAGDTHLKRYPPGSVLENERVKKMPRAETFVELQYLIHEDTLCADCWQNGFDQEIEPRNTAIEFFPEAFGAPGLHLLKECYKGEKEWTFRNNPDPALHPEPQLQPRDQDSRALIAPDELDAETDTFDFFDSRGQFHDN